MCHARAILNEKLNDLKRDQASSINLINERRKVITGLEDELAKVSNQIADVEHALGFLINIPYNPEGTIDE
jgi:septal ring factor EnvC (AmiA/AmiB activator)